MLTANLKLACVSGRGGAGWPPEAGRPDPVGERRESAGSDARAGGRHPEETERDRHTGHPVITHTHTHTHAHTHIACIHVCISCIHTSMKADALVMSFTHFDSWTTNHRGSWTLNLPTCKKETASDGANTHTHTHTHTLMSDTSEQVGSRDT